VRKDRALELSRRLPGKQLRIVGIGNLLFSPQAKPERPEQEIADALISAFEL